MSVSQPLGLRDEIRTRENYGIADIGTIGDGAASECRTRFVGATGEAMKDRARRDAFAIEDTKGVVPRVARVDDEWKIVGVRQRNLRGEHRLLHVAGRVVVVVVEARLADRDHLGVIEQRSDAVEASLRVVGMDAGGRPHSLVGLGNTHRDLRLLEVGPDGDQAGDPCRARLDDDAVVIGAQVAVVVDPRHGGAKALSRGNNGSAASTGRPPG